MFYWVDNSLHWMVIKVLTLLIFLNWYHWQPLLIVSYCDITHWFILLLVSSSLETDRCVVLPEVCDDWRVNAIYLPRCAPLSPREMGGGVLLAAIATVSRWENFWWAPFFPSALSLGCAKVFQCTRRAAHVPRTGAHVWLLAKWWLATIWHSSFCLFWNDSGVCTFKSDGFIVAIICF